MSPFEPAMQAHREHVAAAYETMRADRHYLNLPPYAELTARERSTFYRDYVGIEHRLVIFHRKRRPAGAE